MKRSAFASLLLLAACGRPTAVENHDSAPPATDGNFAVETDPVIGGNVIPTGNLAAPSQSAGSTMTPSRPPDQQSAPDDGNGPRERFIVCPGNPRCPPEGSQPRGRRN